MLQLSELAAVIDATLTGQDVMVKSVSTDSRTTRPGDIFFAIKGDVFDGHDYIEAALQAGAVAAVVSEPVATSLPTLTVAEVSQALADFATYWREQFKLMTVAFTGSCGKTTTRAFLENIYARCCQTLASEKSYNNNYGVALTLLRLRQEHKVLITELGANNPGEIRKLTKQVKPDVAIITNAGTAHIQGFKNIEGVARAKGEIIEGLLPSGVMVINNDDAFADYWKDLAKHCEIVSFGIENSAEVMAKNIHYNATAQVSFDLTFFEHVAPINLQLKGLHNVYNALAAATAALSQGVMINDVKIGLEMTSQVAGRLDEFQGVGGCTVLNDSYNANPQSVLAAIKVLAKYQGKKILVLGDMLELGDAASGYHAEIGQCARLLGIDALYAVGKYTQYAVNTFGEQGFYFVSQAGLVRQLQTELAAGVIVCIKGSADMHMQSIVEQLIDEAIKTV